MELIFLLLTAIFLSSFIFGSILKNVKEYNSNWSFAATMILFNLYGISLLIFIFGMFMNPGHYSEPIDPIDIGYSPFGGKHIITLIFYFILFHISALMVWIKGRKLPPLTLVLSFIFMFIGVIICIPIILQVSQEHSYDFHLNTSGDLSFAFMPTMSILIFILLLIKITNEEIQVSINRTYKNKTLNFLNQKLKDSLSLKTWFFVLLFPVFFICTLILLLFGQDVDSLVKVFTETTTWRFSQQSHPPYLDHQGHYLCTVAAKGDPKIVKPLRLGNRHGNIIIVNRQLMIANAYEEMIQDYTPKFHKLIRYIYDKYGYGFSKHINSPKLSNFTYLAMKPLEWFFLINLYLFCSKPEEKIRKQYL